MTIREKIIALALEEVGYAEKPVNRTKFGLEFGYDGVEWCCIFDCIMLKHAGHSLRLGKQRYNNNGYASVPFIYQDFLDCVTTDPQPGDLAIYHFNKGKIDPKTNKPYVDTIWTPQHIGIFKGWIDRSAKTHGSIEGNTSVANQANGGMVLDRQRNDAYVQAFINVIDAKTH